MKLRKFTHSVTAIALTVVICFSMTACNQTQEKEAGSTSTILPIKALAAKAIDPNPYMASSDANIHIQEQTGKQGCLRETEAWSDGLT